MLLMLYDIDFFILNIQHIFKKIGAWVGIWPRSRNWPVHGPALRFFNTHWTMLYQLAKFEPVRFVGNGGDLRTSLPIKGTFGRFHYIVS